MQVAAINRRARERYAAFVGALDVTAEALDAVQAVINKVDDRFAAGGFTIATRDELTAYRQRAFDDLDRLRSQAKKYEAELVSRDWRL